jgi:MFS family permease
MYGQFNAKWVFIVGTIIFEIGSAICGAAPNIDTLIAGRAICGVGGSGMYVGVITLLSMTTTEKERALYMVSSVT